MACVIARACTLELCKLRSIGTLCCLSAPDWQHGDAAMALQAVALECMRGAHRQQRACYLYAFSGPGDVQELELTTSAPSLTQLLAFLRNRRAPPTRQSPTCRA